MTMYRSFNSIRLPFRKFNSSVAVTRFISYTAIRKASEPPQSEATINLINRAKINHENGGEIDNSALNAYHYFHRLREIKSPLLSDTYTQLPDDTEFITKHYDRLIRYRDFVCGAGGRFDDLPDVEELFLRLSDIHPIKKNEGIHTGDNESIFEDWIQHEVVQFDSFIEDLVTLLKRNGGHLFILDLGIYNVQVFEHFEKVGHTV